MPCPGPTVAQATAFSTVASEQGLVAPSSWLFLFPIGLQGRISHLGLGSFKASVTSQAWALPLAYLAPGEFQ